MIVNNNVGWTWKEVFIANFSIMFGIRLQILTKYLTKLTIVIFQTRPTRTNKFYWCANMSRIKFKIASLWVDTMPRDPPIKNQNWYPLGVVRQYKRLLSMKNMYKIILKCTLKEQAVIE
jgi:hypothetical protein